MNDTCFTIYLAGYSMEYGREATDVCSWRLTRDLYIKNCDMRPRVICRVSIRRSLQSPTWLINGSTTKTTL